MLRSLIYASLQQMAAYQRLTDPRNYIPKTGAEPCQQKQEPSAPKLYAIKKEQQG